jgi:hypothetical protein
MDTLVDRKVVQAVQLLKVVGVGWRDVQSASRGEGGS